MQGKSMRTAVLVLIAANWMPSFLGRTTTAAAQTPNGGDSNGGDLERFLPNNGNSVYDAKGLLRRWDADGPEELWSSEIGWGKSAVVEADGRAFTAAETDDKQWAVCLDPDTGKTLWKHLLIPRKNRHFTSGPVTSPVVDEDRVYFIPYATNTDVWDMCCPIVCLKTDGTELWRVDESFWGTEASTPLVVGDTLYVAADNPDRVVLVALDKLTGKLRWSVAMPESETGRELGAPASLTYQVVDGIPQVIVATYGTREVLGIHATTGRIMWRYDYPAPIIIGMVSTPVAVGSRLFVCAGEGQGKNFSACLQMKAADGKITYEEVYVSTELQTNNFNTVAVYRDAVFGFGGNRAAGFLHCTNFADGRLLWKDASRQWTNSQNLVVADGLIFAITAQNELVLAEASREKFQELGRLRLNVELGRPQQPTIANGRMYIRGMKSVVCYRIAE
ncbi:MAG: PQQ-binding-like beta-propeller repeat protein [Thermoguttaceae bacterium]